MTTFPNFTASKFKLGLNIKSLAAKNLPNSELPNGKIFLKNSRSQRFPKLNQLLFNIKKMIKIINICTVKNFCDSQKEEIKILKKNRLII